MQTDVLRALFFKVLTIIVCMKQKFNKLYGTVMSNCMGARRTCAIHIAFLLQTAYDRIALLQGNTTYLRPVCSDGRGWRTNTMCKFTRKIILQT
jgi:hypothetical protein